MRIDVYHHLVPCDALDALRRIEVQGASIMQSVDQIKAALAETKAAVASIADTQIEQAAAQAEVAKDIAELVAKVSTGELFSAQDVADAQATAAKATAAAAAFKTSADALRDLGATTDASTVGGSPAPPVDPPVDPSVDPPSDGA